MDTVEEKSLFFLRSVLYSLVSQKKEISDKLIEMHVCFRWQPDFSAMEDCSFFFFFFQSFNLVPRVSIIITKSRDLEMRSERCSYCCRAGVAYKICNENT